MREAQHESRVTSLDRALAPERVRLRLASFGFLGHPALRELLPAYFIGLYHSMRVACHLMEVARVRSEELAAECEVAAQLAGYWSRHIREERGHDAWLADDLRNLGVDMEAVLKTPPQSEVAELMGTLYFWVFHTHPIALLSYFYVVETNPPSTETLDFLVDVRGIPRDCLTAHYRHADIDVGHGRELIRLVESLPLDERHEELLALSGRTTLRHLSRIMEQAVPG